MRIDHVVEGSSATARRGGLQDGDLILQIDGKDVPNLVAYETALLTKTPGTTSQLLLRRGGQETRLRVKLDNRFLVLAVNCTHLGCPVSWFASAGLFLCPCHGGVYYENGDRASGPPPRGLYHYLYRIVDGQLHIRAGHMPTLHNTMKEIT
jgi:Rieske Fe-S protein